MKNRDELSTANEKIKDREKLLDEYAELEINLNKRIKELEEKLKLEYRERCSMQDETNQFEEKLFYSEKENQKLKAELGEAVEVIRKYSKAVEHDEHINGQFFCYQQGKEFLSRHEKEKL